MWAYFDACEHPITEVINNQGLSNKISIKFLCIIFIYELSNQITKLKYKTSRHTNILQNFLQNLIQNSDPIVRNT